MVDLELMVNLETLSKITTILCRADLLNNNTNRVNEEEEILIHQRHLHSQT